MNIRVDPPNRFKPEVPGVKEVNHGNLAEEVTMKNLLVLFSLALICLTPATAQGLVLARAGGYELTRNDLEPALELLKFLAQAPLSQTDIQAVINESIADFRTGPQELKTALNDLQKVYGAAQTTTDPLQLGDFRQKVIGELYLSVKDLPPHEIPDYVKILLTKAPVVAYDNNTKVVLTRPDLNACLRYMQQMNEFKGTALSQQDLNTAAQEVIAGFTQIDAETQKLLASGTVLLGVYKANFSQFSEEQKGATKSHFRDTVGGPPSNVRVRGPVEPEPTLTAALSTDGLDFHQALMKSIQSQGGSENYWSLSPEIEE